ncbi:hypothetical protein VPH35_102826 [Triticum aestivum]
MPRAPASASLLPPRAGPPNPDRGPLEPIWDRTSRIAARNRRASLPSSSFATNPRVTPPTVVRCSDGSPESAVAGDQSGRAAVLHLLLPAFLSSLSLSSCLTAMSAAAGASPPPIW